MNNLYQQDPYRVEEGINGLTIHFEGRRSWWTVLIYLALIGYIGYLLIDMLLKMGSSTSAIPRTDLLLIISIGVLAIGYALFRTGKMTLDGLLNVEKITINEREIQVEKSGFLNLERSKTFPVDDKLCFFRLPAGGIAFYKSSGLSKLYQRGLLRSDNIDPMRRFARGLDHDGCMMLLERIQAKYPQYEVFFK